jgi:2'-5' RNA ligase
MFDSHGIPVNWLSSEKFHITLVYLGSKLPLIKRILYKALIKKCSYGKFKITFDSIRVGISKQNKSVIYLNVSEGGDFLRDVLSDFTKKLKIQRISSFVPHLTIGRITKDLSDQEYKNLNQEIQIINRELPLQISFIPSDLVLVESSGVVYQQLNKSRIFV